MDAFVDTHCDEGGQWVVLFFGTLLNCSPPILNALLFSNPVGTGLKPSSDLTKPYWNHEFLLFLFGLFVDQLCVKYPEAHLIDSTPDVRLLIIPTADIIPLMLRICITESDTMQKLELKAVERNATELPHLFWTANAPQLFCFRNRVVEGIDWRNFSEFVEEQMRAVETIVKAMK